MRKFTPYLTATLISFVLIITIFGYYKINPSIPLNYEGDAIVHFNFAKNIAETGWWANNPHFGAPTGQKLYDFPLTENIQLIILKILITFGLNWYQSVNVYFILTFPLVTIAALYVMRKLGLKTSIALPFAIIYSFLPYHFLRGINHLFLSGYYVVPFSIYLTFLIATNEKINLKKLVLLCLLIASCGAYYTYYSLVMISIGGIYALTSGFDKTKLINLFKTLSLIFFFFLLNYLPTLSYVQKYGVNLNTTVRIPKDTELYGLKITQLLLPFDDHNVKFFDKLQKRYILYGSLATNENQYAALGLIAGIGFIILLFWLLFGKNLKIKDSETANKLNLFGVLNVVAILFSMVGGFATLVSTFINPTFRSNNRLSIYIAFFALMTVGLLLQKFKDKRYFMYIPWLLLIFALYDQVNVGVMRNFLNTPDNYYRYKLYADQIKDRVGDNAKIFSLSYGYPEGNDKNFLKVALLTNNITWSAGAQSWRATNYWQYQVSQLPTKEFLNKITAEGFTGLILSPDKMEPDKITQLDNELAELPVSDVKKEFKFYDLRIYAENNEIKPNPSDIFYYVSGNCVFNLKDKYFCKNTARIEIENKSKHTLYKTLKFTVELPDNTLEEFSKQITIPKGNSHSFYKKYTPNESYAIPAEIEAWPLNMGYPNFAIRNLKIE